MQSNSYLSNESSEGKIWKWWSAFWQETRMLGEVKRGSCQTCAILRVSVIVKMIAFVSWDKEDRAKTLLIFALTRGKIFHLPSEGVDWAVPMVICLEKGKQFSKALRRVAWDKQRWNLAGRKWAFWHLTYPWDASFQARDYFQYGQWLQYTVSNQTEHLI